MSFAMTHLAVAKNILSVYPLLNPADFYLGSIAPDAVHYRADYESDFKVRAHLCCDGEKWGMIKDADGWLVNVGKSIGLYENSVGRDFFLGYCVHILTDIYNNINVWTPFRLKHSDEFINGMNYGNTYHTEAAAVDLELYQKYGSRDEIWEQLKKSESRDFGDLVFAVEINELKEKVLYQRYSGKEAVETADNKIITLSETYGFIRDATDFVLKHLKFVALCLPTKERKNDVMDYIDEHKSYSESKMQGSGGLHNAASFEDWLDKIDKNRNPETVEAGLVPGTTYLALNTADNKIVGMLSMRHNLNKYMNNVGGHIGYGVRPTERNKGYATRMLAAALNECRKMGIARVLVTCNANNTASERVIIKNGGRYENDFIEGNGNVVKRYWIELE